MHSGMDGQGERKKFNLKKKRDPFPTLSCLKLTTPPQATGYQGVIPGLTQ